ncbi:MAG: hypothetical protein GY696_05220 [Gammaproteobacteria bacterium]|nr:hypothetical protein [Gammaproteobacteria bacterium]
MIDFQNRYLDFHFKKSTKLINHYKFIPPHWLSPKSPPASVMFLTNKGLPPALTRGVLPDNKILDRKAMFWTEKLDFT